MAQAQANAKVALMLAVGELQRQMGPDSRISAPYDAGDIAPGGGQPHWTAVYDAWSRAEENTPESPDHRKPNFRGWLVSNTGSSGELVSLLDKGSLGDNASDDAIVRISKATIPAATGSGRIAWWMADEGVKAKVNAGPDSQAQASGDQDNPLFRTQSPSHSRHQVLPGLEQLEWNDGQRALALTSGQLGLAAKGSGGLSDGVKGLLHDATVHSQGVLADVRAGRLKRDLSNLLSRDMESLENKPLYLANGRMNWFDIDADGALKNSSGIPAFWASVYNTPRHWGINIEELALFHNIHREIEWQGGAPILRRASSREGVVSDRYYMYRKPAVPVMQFIFSLSAVPANAPGRFDLKMNMDAMIALSNPNDVALVQPPGLEMPFQLLNIPYQVKLDIQRPSGNITRTSRANNFNIFKAYIEGGTGGEAPNGFRLEPGESATYGAAARKHYLLNLRRGFIPNGAVEFRNSDWNLNAKDLEGSASVDVTFERTTSYQPNSGAWTYCNWWIGPREGQNGWQMDSTSVSEGTLDNGLINNYLPKEVRAPQKRLVSQLVNQPQAILMVSFLQNVEQPSRNNPPDAFASRPFQLDEAARAGRTFNPGRFEQSRHDLQTLVTAEALDFTFRSEAAGDGGQHIYLGGGRQPNLGGSSHQITRRLPLAPPLSLGAFQNAIASGFCNHFKDESQLSQTGMGLTVGSDKFPASAVGLTGHVHGLPLVARAIGSSFSLPHLDSDEVFSTDGRTTAAKGRVGNIATDHSWMVNTALWDSWFLSGLVNPTSGGSPWLNDSRSPRAQFKEFAEAKGHLKNIRMKFYHHKPAEQALEDLFSGETLKNGAISRLANYLMVDGCFNVNSTSEKAWEALLASIREQSLYTKNGGTSSFRNPLGTLGYAASTATSGPDGDWNGFRDLTDREIEKLASAMAGQVKARGPFLSMADFVNRRPDSNDPAHRAVGALQAAIDSSGLNDRFTGGTRTVAPDDFSSLPGGAVADEPIAAPRAIGAAGHLTQADMLTAVGPYLTVRSDTFVIRSYGEARDRQGNIQARAWCEAVVQRTPEYVDPANAPETDFELLSPANAAFGRRFDLIAFRWLSDSDV